MTSPTSAEVCQGFLQWVSRFGVPKVAISDNGNTFVANLYKDLMKQFNIEVKFTPMYHAATNGAIERRHQTIKNSLKAALVDMGNTHGDRWMQALPWVLMGKRCAFQADYDTSASILAFGRSPLLPGQLLGHPGPPMTNAQVKDLLLEMEKIDNKPALQTSAKIEELDISQTNNITHVYVKVDDPRGLNPRFQGPFPVISRPSRSQVEVKVGSYADGRPRLSIFHWSSCKIANLREDFKEASRPNLGRRPDPPTVTAQLKPIAPSPVAVNNQEENKHEVAAKIQTRQTGPSEGSSEPRSRPVRATRNQNPIYVDGIAIPA